MRDTLLLNSEYKALHDRGGDDLVAFFATIRGRKSAIMITMKCKERLTGAITTISGLSRNTVKKYLPELIALGLVKQQKGVVLIRGRKWSHNNLPRLKNKKLIPIQVCEKFTDTKTSSYYVRVHSNLRKQQIEIDKKAERIQILKRHHRGQTKSLKELKQAKRLLKKGNNLDSQVKNYRSNRTISNEGFYKLKKGIKSKGSGNYQKTKLLKRQLIEQDRNVKLFLEGVFSYSCLIELRESFDFGGFFVGKKGIYFEDSPTLSIVA